MNRPTRTVLVECFVESTAVVTLCAAGVVDGLADNEQLITNKIAVVAVARNVSISLGVLCEADNRAQ